MKKEMMPAMAKVEEKPMMKEMPMMKKKKKKPISSMEELKAIVKSKMPKVY